MDNLYYYHSVRRTSVQMLDLFNNMQVAKYNTDGSIAKVINVPLRFGPKEKFLFWLLRQKKHERRLPFMGMSMTSIEFASDRMVNNSAAITYSVPISGDAVQYMKHVNPTPYNIHYKLSIASQYMVEMDQILEQVLPFFDPYVEIRVALPEFNNSYNVKVTLDTINQGTVPDTPQDEYRMVLWDLEFTAQAYMFKPVKDITIIKKIIDRYYTNQDAFSAMKLIDPTVTDSYPLSANHDFDAKTTFMEGAIINNNVNVIKYEEYDPVD